jgi:hypothetical protein
METRVLLIFDLFQRTIKPRRDAFDKCSVLEIKNPALLPAFVFRDIKDIILLRADALRRIGRSARARSKCPDMARRTSRNSSNELKEGQNLRSTNSQSNGFDFFQTDSRQSAEFLIFNQSFLFKGDSENAETRPPKRVARRRKL